MMVNGNVIGREKLQKVIGETLEVLDGILQKCYGPNTSHTIISKLNNSTKDGKNILSDVQFLGEVQEFVRAQIYDVCRQVVKNIGDGTTSAVILSNAIYKALMKYAELHKDDMTPYQIIEEFKAKVEIIRDKILENKKELDDEAIYNIAYTSTNGNKVLSQQLLDIYKEFGDSVYIDVSVSLGGDSYIKSYNGLTLDAGYIDSAFINSANNEFRMRNPKIYTFKDPVNTPDMINFFDKIIKDNIIDGVSAKDPNKIHPMVIFMPEISRDLSTYLDNLIAMMANITDVNSRFPICIVNHVIDRDQYSDIVKLCGGKYIEKYINEETYKDMCSRGMAPTLKNVSEFYGTCEEIVINATTSQFINPSKMRDANGEYTATFNNLIAFIEKELAVQREQGGSLSIIGTLKRRLQSLKSNLVEFNVGGVNMNDRDAVKDALEDAVLNLRSAAKDGYGRAANVEGYMATADMDDELGKLIHDAYKYAITVLCKNSNLSDEEISDIFTKYESDDSKSLVYDLRVREYSDKVLTSIETDRAVLDAIGRIVSMLFSANQLVCQQIAEANMVNND